MTFDHLRSGDVPDEEKRARRIYYATCVSATAWIYAMPLLMPAHAPLLWGVTVFVLEAACGAGTRACRLAGVSREGDVSEWIERSAGAALAPHLGAAPVFESRLMKYLHLAVDAEGIRARHGAKEWRRVRWRDIEACALTAKRDAIGRCKDAQITFYGADGQVLLHFSPLEGDADKLLAAVRFHLRGEESAPEALWNI